MMQKKAGFEKVVFIIKKENEADFKEAVGKTYGRSNGSVLCIPGFT